MILVSRFVWSSWSSLSSHPTESGHHGGSGHPVVNLVSGQGLEVKIIKTLILSSFVLDAFNYNAYRNMIMRLWR